MAEHAVIDDGRLDIYLVYPGRFCQLVASLLHLKFRLKKPDILKQLSATLVCLRTDRPRTVDADGELAAQTPATFRVWREALTGYPGSCRVSLSDCRRRSSVRPIS